MCRGLTVIKAVCACRRRLKWLRPSGSGDASEQEGGEWFGGRADVRTMDVNCERQAGRRDDRG